MKEIRAILQPHKLDDVLFALRAIPDLPAVAISDCRVAAAHDDPFGEVRKTRIELVVEDGDVETVVRTIARAARTGQPGDGRIFVLDVERSVLIRDASPPPESPGEGMG